jgi:hypothetical protein
LAEALNSLLGLTQAGQEGERLDADEMPQPEVSAWAEPLLERVA